MGCLQRSPDSLAGKTGTYGNLRKGKWRSEGEERRWLRRQGKKDRREGE